MKRSEFLLVFCSALWATNPHKLACKRVSFISLERSNRTEVLQWEWRIASECAYRCVLLLMKEKRLETTRKVAAVGRMEIVFKIGWIHAAALKLRCACWLVRFQLGNGKLCLASLSRGVLRVAGFLSWLKAFLRLERGRLLLADKSHQAICPLRKERGWFVRVCAIWPRISSEDCRKPLHLTEARIGSKERNREVARTV
jgi:hypothetical protein